jgi:hypothetical protein
VRLLPKWAGEELAQWRKGDRDLSGLTACPAQPSAPRERGVHDFEFSHKGKGNFRFFDPGYGWHSCPHYGGLPVRHRQWGWPMASSVAGHGWML